mgnify:FL=1
MLICAALDVTPEYLLSGVTEDSKRGQIMDYVVIPKDTEERWVIDTFGKMGFEDREHLISYMKMMAKE